MKRLPRTSCFHFTGTLDSTRRYREGEVAFDVSANTMMIYTKNEWIPFGEPSETDTEEFVFDPLKFELITHCYRCGAPLDITDKAKRVGHTKCKYCESEVAIFKRIDVS